MIQIVTEFGKDVIDVDHMRTLYTERLNPTNDLRNITWAAFLDVEAYDFHFDENKKSGIVNQLILSHSSRKERETWLLTILPPTLVAVVISMMFYEVNC